MKLLRIPPMYKCIGLIDADLLDKGSRHPNLALLKIAGFLFDNHIPFELILDYNSDFIDMNGYIFLRFLLSQNYQIFWKIFKTHI